MSSGVNAFENKFYLYRFFSVFPSFVPRYVWIFVLFSLSFVFSGFRIVYDSLVGVFPVELNVLRELFVWNWATCIYYSLLSIYLSVRFYGAISRWIDSQEFVSDANVKENLRRSVQRFLDFGFGRVPLVAFVLIYVLRRFILRAMEPSFDGEYYVWYLGGDAAVIFVLLSAFWSLILFSAVLRYVAGAFPLKVRDLAEYKERFKDLIVQANLHILILGLVIATFFFGNLFWSFSMGTIQYYYASTFLFILAGVVILLIFWLNFSGIQSGLEKTKSAKIMSIRSERFPSEMRDLQIFLHSQISIWQIGPKLFDSFLRPLIIAEMPIIIQSIIDFFKILSS